MDDPAVGTGVHGRGRLLSMSAVAALWLRHG